VTTSIILDTGALIALDRNDRRMWGILRVAADDGVLIQVPTGAIAQAWRDGSRQVLLARALRHCDEVPLDGVAARAAGLLCGQSGSIDVIDASIAIAANALARSGQTTIFTSDPVDIASLTSSLRTNVRIEHV
jgi:hypothetical protein